jgi:hypothetical protein
MKTLITLLTATVLVGGATAAMASDQQATAAELDNQLNWQMARDFGGAHASARKPGPVTNDLSQSAIDFQAQGSY